MSDDTLARLAVCDAEAHAALHALGVERPDSDAEIALACSEADAETSPSAVLITGNPKYIKDNPAADKFYEAIEQDLKAKGYTVRRDPGEPYTSPPNANLWIGHSRGADRLRFAPSGTRTLAFGSNAKGAINHPDDVVEMSAGHVPPAAHYVFTPEMADAIHSVKAGPKHKPQRSPDTRRRDDVREGLGAWGDRAVRASGGEAMTTIEDVLAGRAKWCVIEGDSRVVVPTLPAACVHAVVTDPPSGISFMGAAWDHHKGGRAQWVAWLAAILAASRVACVDGARLVSWAMPRTSHWTGCAIEDAGWIIETKGVHLQGQGWPKGKSQLKPAAEDWWFARTGPSTVLNIDECRVRVGADDFAAMTGRSGKSTPSAVYGGGVGWHGEGTWSPSSTGRYPPNTLLSHLPACRLTGTRRVATGTAVNRNRDPNARNSWLGTRAPQTEDAGHADADGAESVDAWECAEGCAVAMLDAQSGVSVSSGHTRNNAAQGMGFGGAASDFTVAGVADEGGASRFFPQFRASLGVPFLYCAKPSRGEKNEGREELPQSDAASVAAFASNKVKRCSACERTHPVAHVGTCLRCGCGDLALDDAADDGRGRDGCRVRANTHPTVKSVALMRWLVRLITKPGDVVLDPFGGSGTTGVAALREGRRVILVEREPDFAAICRARLEHAAPSRERLATMASTPVRVEAANFGPLFNR